MRSSDSNGSAPAAVGVEDLRLVEAIARHGTLTAAAESLHRVPSAVSYALRALEARLGARLFERTPRGMAPTPAARLLLAEGALLRERAESLARRVRQTAAGWEPELAVAVDDLAPLAPVMEAVRELLAEGLPTRVRLLREVFGGTWDALAAGRAVIAVAAPGEPPPVGGISAVATGTLEFVFAVAPGHPLAEAPEPLAAAAIERHPVVVAADSSRHLPARTAGVLPGQPVLRVADMAQKLAAQRAGAGVGYLPRPLAEREARAGRLVIRAVEAPPQRAAQHLAWRTDAGGPAQARLLAALRARLAPGASQA